MSPTTRTHFQEELAKLEEQALGAMDLVASTLERTLEAVRGGDAELAEIVISDDDRIDGRYLEVHQGILSLLALQAPVASDLRLVAALLHVIKHIERIGDQCVNVAKLLPLQGETVDERMLANLDRMGELARSLVVQAKLAFERRDVGLAKDLVRQDDEIDDLNRECFQIALEVGDDVGRRQCAMQTMLAARAIERIGDNAVDIGEQAAFVVTGEFREFEDASHPEATPQT